MTREDIIRMSSEAGFAGWKCDEKKIERFAALVAAAEREACAKVCMPNFIGEYPPGSGRDDRYDLAKADCAAAIRGRSA